VKCGRGRQTSSWVSTRILLAVGQRSTAGRGRAAAHTCGVSDERRARVVVEWSPAGVFTPGGASAAVVPAGLAESEGGRDGCQGCDGGDCGRGEISFHYAWSYSLTHGTPGAGAVTGSLDCPDAGCGVASTTSRSESLTKPSVFRCT
jgi:hypothetical protein